MIKKILNFINSKLLILTILVNVKHFSTERLFNIQKIDVLAFYIKVWAKKIRVFIHCIVHSRDSISSSYTTYRHNHFLAMEKHHKCFHPHHQNPRQPMDCSLISLFSEEIEGDSAHATFHDDL